MMYEEDRYRELIENITEVIYTLDKDAVITYVNGAAESLFGFKPEELIGQHISIIFDRAEVERGERNVRRIVAGEIIGPSVYQVFTKSKERRWVRVRSRLVIEDGEMMVHGVLMDITEYEELQRRHEEAVTIIAKALQRVRNPLPDRNEALTSREEDVLHLVGMGYTNRRIADRLSVSKTTVGSRITSIYEKLNVKNRVEMALYAIKHGYTLLDEILLNRHTDTDQINRK